MKKTRNRALAILLAAVMLSGCGQSPADTAGTGTQPGENSSASSAASVSAPNPSGESNAAGQDGALEEEEIPILKDKVYEAMGSRMGCAATEAELNDEQVWEIITTHFNAITFGNELKPDALVGYSVGTCPGTEEAELNGETIVVPKLDYSRAERMLDKVYNWNAEHPDNKIMVKGHVLVWHAQTPEWFFHVDYDKNKDYVDKDTMNKRLEWYIRTVLTHFTGEDSKYKDLFYGWDVVNEACSDNPSRVYRSDAENPNESLSEDRHGSNSSWWHIYQSNEYIINAFIYANKYAPADLELYYNDYNECVRSKITSIMELLKAIKAQEGEPGVGTRITAMGMQGHYSMESPSFTDMEWAIKQYASVVGNVQISEFDMKARSTYDGSDEAKEEEYQAQYLRYKTLYISMKWLNDDPNINVTGITFWGTVDKYSWLQYSSNVGGGSTGNLPQCPLLFDENYQVKPAFYAFTEDGF
ncbi:MAG: endo-1,4-beta-xylanase [Acetatifactor sp.]